jgi:prolipoprotein diacylglyceryltransferase
MVPVEVTAFGLLAVCVILLAVVLAVQLMPRPATFPTRALMGLALVVVVVLAIYVWATTRTR